MGGAFGAVLFRRVRDGHQDARGQAVQPRALNAALGPVVNVANDPIDVYYVIIGRGPMAVVNHLTLRADRSNEGRVGNRRIMHIGFPNPWPRYFQHGLGQPNHLLSFPAFDNGTMTGGPSKDSGLDSQHFGARIDAEFAQLNLPDDRVKTMWVALVQARGQQNELPQRAFERERPGAADVRGRINAVARTPWPDPVAAPDAHYRLCLYLPDPQNAQNHLVELVYASHIDICTGPGRPRVGPAANQRQQEDPQIVAARTPPWISPESWTAADRDRKVMNGVDAIRDEAVWQGTDRICITAGGGVGLNAAEKARDADACADWFGRTGLTPILLNPRNRTFLQLPRTHPRWRTENWMMSTARNLAGFLFPVDPPKPEFQIGQRFTLGDLYHQTGIREDENEANIFPATPYARMGRDAVLGEVGAEDDKVRVRLVPSDGNARPSIRDYSQTTVGLGNGRWEFSDEYTRFLSDKERVRAPSTLYDRLVIPNGQDSNTLGQPSSVCGGLVFAPLSKAGRMVCLQTADERVRVLGAACNNYSGYTIGEWTDGRGNEQSGRMWEYHATLPKCAVPDGFIICSINTAVANGYFGDGQDVSNANVNTMTHAEAEAVFGQPTADAVVDWRNELNGYASAGDLCAVVMTGDTPPQQAIDALKAAEARLLAAKRAHRALRRNKQPEDPYTPEETDAQNGEARAEAARDLASLACAPVKERMKLNRERIAAMTARQGFDPAADAEFRAFVGPAHEECVRLHRLVNQGAVVFAYPDGA